MVQKGGHRTGDGALLEVGELKIPDVVHGRDLAGSWVAPAAEGSLVEIACQAFEAYEKPGGQSDESVHAQKLEQSLQQSLLRDANC